MKKTHLGITRSNPEQCLSERVRLFIESEKLLKQGSRVLIAVSGGLDSIVLLDLMSKLGFSIAAAHCNFGLRGIDSDEDERLVKNVAKELGIEYFSIGFETTAHAKSKKLSIQEVARDLRYNWFNQISQDKGFDHIATAHNLNDSVETLLINLVRGTGIRGLAGIPLKNGKIIRPLLFATRAEIEEYASKNSLIYRTDSSNNQDYYLRNKIRHNVLPILEEANPMLYDTMIDNFGKISEAIVLIDNYVEAQRRVCVEETKTGIAIEIEELMRAKTPKLVMHEILKGFGFSPAVCKDLFNALHSQPGKVFFSHSHRAIKDRSKVFVESIGENIIEEHKTVDETTKSIEIAGRNFTFASLTLKKGMEIPKDPNAVWLDKDKLQFPLIFRKIVPGDSMVPIGMKGNKKVSDILIDLKIPLHEKEKVLVLVSGRKLVWLVGLKIGDGFKITSKTKEVFEIARTCDKYHR